MCVAAISACSDHVFFFFVWMCVFNGLLQNTAPAQPAAPSTLAPAPEAPTAQPGLPLASSVAQPLSQTAAASSELGGAELQQVEMLEGLLGTAIEKLGQEVSGLGAAVKSRDGRQVAAATNQVAPTLPDSKTPPALCPVQNTLCLFLPCRRGTLRY